jgi:LPPG:FO 2-phospho-L-lactate transferase
MVSRHSAHGRVRSAGGAAGEPVSAAGVASLYSGLLDGLVMDSDDPQPGPRDIPVLACPTMMRDADDRRRLAQEVLNFARGLGD